MYENDFSFVRLFRAYRRILDFQGRSTRTELLGYWVATSLASTVLGYASVFGSQSDDTRLLLGALLNLILLIPAPALAVRRAHDIGLPGVSALLLIAPAAAGMIFGTALEPYATIHFHLGVAYLTGLVMLLWKPQEGQNRYGPDPRLAPLDDAMGTE